MRRTLRFHQTPATTAPSAYATTSSKSRTARGKNRWSQQFRDDRPNQEMSEDFRYRWTDDRGCADRSSPLKPKKERKRSRNQKQNHRDGDGAETATRKRVKSTSDWRNRGNRPTNTAGRTRNGMPSQKGGHCQTRPNRQKHFQAEYDHGRKIESEAPAVNRPNTNQGGWVLKKISLERFSRLPEEMDFPPRTMASIVDD